MKQEIAPWGLEPRVR